MTNEIYNNQDNKDFKITINKRTYDWKNAKTIWTKITTSKISKNVAKKLYEELIQKDIDALTLIYTMEGCLTKQSLKKVLQKGQN